MNKATRKTIIAGNWKMNKTPAEATALISEIAPLVKDADCEVIACVPYVDLYTALEAAKGTNIQIGAENCHWQRAVLSQLRFLLICLLPWVLSMLSSVTLSAVSTSARQTLLLRTE